ncbi:MAG: NUDIX domain-containing protein [Micromonosporaceae bacterium]|nr:NUDIX domain-containing protein [Micromonosporaceae bacterium]
MERHRPRTGEEASDLARVRAALAGDVWSRSTPLHVTGSALIVHPASRRVLLRWHTRQQAWLQVGGHADPGETDPLVTALREGREETGLEDLEPWSATAPIPGRDESAEPAASGGEILHLVIVPVTANAQEPAHEHADVRYLLATDRPDAARPEKPDAPLRWLSIEAAHAATSKPNLRETITRAARLLG